MQASIVGQTERSVPSWWSRYEQWTLTLGSGLALAAGTAISWLAPAMGLGSDLSHRVALACFGLAVVVGGVGLFPRAPAICGDSDWILTS